MVVLFLLLIIDYILTYMGLHYFGVITEMNPLMVRIMDFPFRIGFPIRIIQSIIIISLTYYINVKDKRYYKIVVRTGFLVYSVVLILHLNWIVRLANN